MKVDEYEEIKKLIKLMELSEEEVIEKFKDCRLRPEDVNSFLIGYVRRSLQFMIENV